jgi:hypothetical protein
MSDRPDRLIVHGLGVLDGEYDFDLIEMITGSSTEGLTFRELRQIKQISEVRAGEIWEELGRGNSDLTIALATVVMTRAGKRVEVDVLLDAPATTELRFVLADRAPKEDEADPPVSTPPGNDSTETGSNSGGDDSRKTSEQPGNGLSRTGVLGLALSGQRTSET